jgi:hypothetical protein
MLNVAILELYQPSFVNDKDVRFLKRATRLQSFRCGSLCCEGGCSVGNLLTVKLLQYLAPALLELKLGSSPGFILPNPYQCRWPPGLQTLFMKKRSILRSFSWLVAKLSATLRDRLFKR